MSREMPNMPMMFPSPSRSGPLVAWKVRSPSVVVDGRVYCRVSIPGRLAKWTEGIYLDAEYAEVKTRTGICVIFERTECGAVENVFVVTADRQREQKRRRGQTGCALAEIVLVQGQRRLA